MQNSFPSHDENLQYVLASMGLSSASGATPAASSSSEEQSPACNAVCTSNSNPEQSTYGSCRRRLQQDIIGPFSAKQDSELQQDTTSMQKKADGCNGNAVIMATNESSYKKQEDSSKHFIPIITTIIHKFSSFKTPFRMWMLALLATTLLVRLILSCAAGQQFVVYQACTDAASNPSFLNLTAVLNVTTAKAVVERNSGWMAKIAFSSVGRRQNKKHAQQASSSNVHMVYMADAYTPEAGSVCLWRSHDHSFNWLQQPDIPFFKPSIIASAFTPSSSNHMATFLKKVNADKVPEDWHIEAFGNALSKACDQVRKKSASMMHWANFDDILVPNRLCSMADRILLTHSSSSSATSKGPAATIGSMLRLDLRASVFFTYICFTSGIFNSHNFSYKTKETTFCKKRYTIKVHITFE